MFSVTAYCAQYDGYIETSCVAINSNA